MYRRFILFTCCSALLLLAWGLASWWGADRVAADPQDVRGSSNVAVSGYSNAKGHFTLWSSGLITSLQGQIINEAQAYDLAPQFRLPQRAPGQCLGSGNVAVGVFVAAEASYVVFADGTVRRPRDARAGAGQAQGRQVAGTLLPCSDSSILAAGAQHYQGGFSRSHKRLGGNRAETTITFEEPFTTKPTIFLSPMSQPARRYKGNYAQDFQLQRVTQEAFTVSYEILGTLPSTYPDLGSCYFLAVGE